MKTILIAIMMLVYIPVKLYAVETDSSAKEHFYKAKEHIEDMLSGKAPLSYERAIYEIENAWYGGQISYASFKHAIDFHVGNIQSLISVYQDSAKLNPERDLLETKKQKIENYKEALTNYAIYQYITRPTIFLNSNGITANKSYEYSYRDPLGTSNWENTQVTNLINNHIGNCFALASLYKIFSERLLSNAKLCTAPGHIYISHADEKGTPYNIELSSRTFPGSGTLETITYTPNTAVKSGIAMRELDTKQSLALCLVYLAKGYESKLGINNEFMLACASQALRHDEHNLNAMLLKAELLESSLLSQNKDFETLSKQKDFLEYEQWIKHIYQLGYREMPYEMKNTLIKGWTRDTFIALSAKANMPQRLTKKGLEDIRYAGLSWGLFDEEIKTKQIERYSNTAYDTKTKKVIAFTKEDVLYNQYNFDPIVFAWNVDPLAHKFPSWSPYSAFGDNPIKNIDPDGRAFIVADKAQQKTVMGYMREQLGVDIFKFNNRGSLELDKNAYKSASGNFNANQKSIAEGMIKIVKSDRILEAKLYPDQNINFVRNPTVTETTKSYDPSLGRDVTTTSTHPMYSGKGIIIPKLNQEAITINIPGDDRAFILMDYNASEKGTFKSKDGQTNPCGSCLFLHEALDHGLDYIDKGDVSGGQTHDNVKYHNKALENTGSPTRTGEDHGKN